MLKRITTIATTVFVLMLGLGLGACAHDPAEPIIVIKEVKVIVPVRCQVSRPVGVSGPDTDQALAMTPDVFEGTKLLLAGRTLRLAYIGQLEAAFDACAQAPIGDIK